MHIGDVFEDSARQDWADVWGTPRTEGTVLTAGDDSELSWAGLKKKNLMNFHYLEEHLKAQLKKKKKKCKWSSSWTGCKHQLGEINRATRKWNLEIGF